MIAVRTSLLGVYTEGSSTCYDTAIMVELSIYIVLFILASGLLSLTDAALLSISYAEVEEMHTQGKIGSAALRRVYRRLTRAVVVIVIITNTINVLGPILVGQRAVQLYGSDVIGIITAILTASTILFSEIIPKALGSHYAPIISRIIAPIILVLTIILYPLAVVLENLVNLFKMGKRAIGTEEQIRALARRGGAAGHIQQAEGELIHRVFILNDKRARDLMTPRKRVAAIPDTATIRQAVGEIAKYPHSRYPVYEKSLDHTLGVVLSRDLYEAVGKGQEKESILTVMRPVLFVPASMRSDALLLLFRQHHMHLAVVLDGAKVIGIVSLEDVLEELVGEIEDERDAGKILS
jgi:CBS domain containing-hemolysin-like protein